MDQHHFLSMYDIAGRLRKCLLGHAGVAIFRHLLRSVFSCGRAIAGTSEIAQGITLDLDNTCRTFSKRSSSVTTGLWVECYGSQDN